ncbi:hypothetical protein LEP1GSC052_3880 [Leptospira kmetyi serovar Malaysia str. Bejo-Iso9]|nr:hypothetical protein LEP1GSC052_3880 [Leptospira kmetyi serovar Malaysia str. Bejo-Iso9]
MSYIFRIDSFPFKPHSNFIKVRMKRISSEKERENKLQ